MHIISTIEEYNTIEEFNIELCCLSLYRNWTSLRVRWVGPLFWWTMWQTTGAMFQQQVILMIVTNSLDSWFTVIRNGHAQTPLASRRNSMGNAVHVQLQLSVCMYVRHSTSMFISLYPNRLNSTSIQLNKKYNTRAMHKYRVWVTITN